MAIGMMLISPMNRRSKKTLLFFIPVISSLFLGMSICLTYAALVEADFLMPGLAFENPDPAGFPADKKQPLMTISALEFQSAPLTNLVELFPSLGSLLPASDRDKPILRC
jgi:hypothetical protein